MRILLKMTVLQFKMLLRNRTLLVGSLGVAVISMLIFGALFSDNTIPPLSMGVVDLDQSPVSRQVVDALKTSAALEISEGAEPALLEALKAGSHSGVIVIKPGFGAGLATASAQVQFYVDETDLVGAARSRATINGIFEGVSKQISGAKSLVVVEEQKVAVRSIRQIDMLTPGMLGQTIMFANMAVGLLLLGWRERGTLKRLSATPLRSWQLIGSQIISQLALSFAQVALILILAVTVFQVELQAAWLPSIAVFAFAGAFSMIALGYAIGNFVQKQDAATSVINMISIPMMFLGASYFPVNPPPFLKPLVEALPLTHLNRAFREIMLRDSGLAALGLNLAVLLGFGVVLLALSIRTFKWSR